MTRLQAAVRWWSRADHQPIPQRHFDALWKARFIVFDADEQWFDLTEAGKKAFRDSEGV